MLALNSQGAKRVVSIRSRMSINTAHGELVITIHTTTLSLPECEKVVSKQLRRTGEGKGESQAEHRGTGAVGAALLPVFEPVSDEVSVLHSPLY